MINWNVRLRNKRFVLGLVSAIILVVQAVAKVFGLHLSLDNFSNNIVGVINSVFAVLALLNVVGDPTTAGFGDSEQALTYDKPKEDK